ncbi:UDP-N-acetylmuramoyl-tripeptide--D-alanyl-D-alanine ligase [Marinitoga hydrogenitolerans DSM 16785]|uniref:UDP-N-acetylmuramoyl-tripeptide--D-alanyl-D-alanine ligase n=1 Tax=Marinitoga hydrogenitolerans (strain DSM 16785 / JCM 12826 / AT1271) TaxID=1122195 RepID=A0A1M4TF65_MARH1|nr:UDP-N-acetylmuramoyl-tripeptide--D-alanyl-D-alanine ligase [Marinitoga hydrogenitolerans]SHE43048.1 UDP-N-acetylmuramoyl-tripeptide--D-alanyl-D-alanine ligase [Marinitoga hydrogenitolerans DSM 16785]
MNISHYEIDSRKIKENDIFIAIKGEKNNGHDFVNDALKKGAKTAIVEEKRNYIKEVILVNNVIDYINEKASKLLKERSKIRIGITGSNGKTTTKFFLFHLLSYGFNVFTTEKNYNTEIGLPLSILNNFKNQPVSVLEMGLRKENDIEYLSKYYNPNISIILNIGTAHIEFFKTRKKIAEEKLKIISYAEKPGLLFINGDEPLLNIEYPKDIKVFRFGEKNDNDGYLLDFEYLKGNTRVYYNIYNENLMLTLPGIWNKGQLIDVLASLMVSLYFEIPLDPFYISNFSLPEKRFELKEVGSSIIINDAYNASKESFFSAFESIKKMNINKKKILLMSEVLEIGDIAQKYHQEIVNKACEIFDKIYFYDPQNKFDFKDIIFLNKKNDIIKILKSENSLIYVKGSNGTGLWKIVEEFIESSK